MSCLGNAECEVPCRHSKDGKDSYYMGLELSGKIETGDKSCESSENPCDMKPAVDEYTREINKNKESRGPRTSST